MSVAADKLPRQIGAALLLYLIAAASVFADPYPVDDRIDVEHYRFDLVLSDETDRIEVDAAIELLIEDPATPRLILDLVGPPAAGDATGMTVSAVTAGETALPFSHRDDRLEIELPRAAAQAGRLALTVSYAGTPATGLIIGDTKYGDRSFFSDNWPNKARHWLATVDHIADKATSEFIVTAPSRLQVVSNGLLLERTNLDSQRTLTHWRQAIPISPWLYVIGAAEFAVQYLGDFDGKSIQTWVYRQDRDRGFGDFATPTKDALAFYSAWVGPFEYEKLANIQSNSVGGGMEAASAILYGDDSVTGEGEASRRWQSVIVHEIAHQWFGNSVTEGSWDDVWLSEGFATYFTYLYFEHARGRDAFRRYLVEARDKAMAFSAENPGYTIQHADLQDMADVTTGQIYDKGAWILHMLRDRIGDASWWRGIRAYYARHRNGTATTADFRREMESACVCDLRAYFDFWLRTESEVILEGDWLHDAEAGTVQIAIEHRGGAAVEPRLEVDAAIHYPDRPLPDIVTLPLGKHDGAHVVEVRSRPTHIQLDPNVRLLADWTFAERRPATETARATPAGVQHTTGGVP